MKKAPPHPSPLPGGEGGVRGDIVRVLFEI